VDKMLEKTIRLKTLRKANNRIKGYITLFNLDPTKPLFSFIGRLLEKGKDLSPPGSFSFVRKL
jgi:starch synthase